MESKSLSAAAADVIVGIIGSWPFAIGQSLFFVGWMIGNALGWFHFDPPPWLKMNIVMSIEAAYAATFVLIADRRSSQRNRQQLALIQKLLQANLDQMGALLALVEASNGKDTPST